MAGFFSRLLIVPWKKKLLCRQLHTFTFTIPCLSHHRPHFDLVKAKQVNKIVVVILLPVNLETIQAFIWVTGKWFWMALLAHYSVKSSCQSLQLSGWMMENYFVLLYLTILLPPVQSKEDLQCVVFTKNIWSNQIFYFDIDLEVAPHCVHDVLLRLTGDCHRQLWPEGNVNLSAVILVILVPNLPRHELVGVNICCLETLGKLT